jgi:hypothetical protein
MDPGWNHNTDQGRVATCDPPNWISTEQLETELLNAIMDDSNGIPDDEDIDIQDIDEYFDEDDKEDETEHRRSTLRLLALMRPQLGELLGAPPSQ